LQGNEGARFTGPLFFVIDKVEFCTPFAVPVRWVNNRPQANRNNSIRRRHAPATWTSGATSVTKGLLRS
jgi:hypothetical protein